MTVEPESASSRTDTSRWRLRYRVGDLLHFTEWTTEFATVENLAEQYRRRADTSGVTIERRDRLEPVTDGGDQVLITTADRVRRYHRRADCTYAVRLDGREWVPRDSLEDVEPCSYCALEDRSGGEELDVCPTCDRAQIQQIPGGFPCDGPAQDYRCGNCGERFDEPETRQRRRAKSSNRSGLAGTLLQADPEDLGSEDDQLLTDGGQEFTPPVEQLVGETEVEFQCAVGVDQPYGGDMCGHEAEPIELEEPAYLDDQNRIHLPGRPVACPDCGQDMEFEFDGVRVIFA